MADSSTQPEWQAPPQNAWMLFRRPPPRVIVKADLLPALSAMSLIGLLGIPLGWIWSRLAPGRHVQVLPGDDVAPLPMEVWHQFTDVSIFLLLGLAAGVVVGVAVWFLRARRGPVMMLAAAVGSTLCAVFAMRLGTAFANSLHALEQAPRVGQVLTRAPVLPTWWILIAQPLATVFVYGILAIWNARDDLGRRLG